MVKNNIVAIIGAGVAGLSCATALQKAGFIVTVFEKSLGVSGRLSTRVTADWQCDHGAQYFTTRSSLFNAEVQRWVEAGVAKLWQPRLMMTDGHQFFAKESRSDRFVGYPFNSSPAKWLAQSLNIYTETTVTSLKKNADQWIISSKAHGAHPQPFNYVLLAIPAPQAALLLKDTAQNLYDFASNIKMQACFALMLNIQNRLNTEFDGLFINNGFLSWVARDSSKPGRLNPENKNSRLNGNGNINYDETWILHANSKWSELHVEDKKENVSQEMMEEFIRIIQSSEATDQASLKVEPQSHTLHHWLYADCENYLSCGYQLDQQQNIGLCGDWLNGGKVQGAWLSGLMLANHLINSV
jgi:predicted NAD/FAD-dependent oxidoreductase